MLDILHAKMAFQSFIVGRICLDHHSCYFTLDFSYGSYLSWNKTLKVGTLLQWKSDQS